MMIFSTLAAMGDNIFSIIIATAVMLVLVVVGFIAAIAIRRHYHDSDSGSMMGPAFTLQDLRRMRRKGEITEEQYEKLREQIIGALAPREAPPPREEAAEPEPPASGEDEDKDKGEQA